MEASYRLKIKIGEHEFEAEGAAETVHQEFMAFKELISSFSSNSPAQSQTQLSQAANAAKEIDTPPDTSNIDAALRKIMKVEYRIVSLTVRVDTVEEAVLLLLYGQRILRQNDLATGSQIMDGLTKTGDLFVSRIDKLLKQMELKEDVIIIGQRRGKRYRLTNAGITKARQLAVDLITLVP